MAEPPRDAVTGTQEVSPSDARRLRGIRLILLDVDGVLTDGSIVLVEGGGEMQRFHVRDGAGIKIAQEFGLDFGILTGRAPETVSRRARELGITLIRTGALDKGAAFDELLAVSGHLASEVAYMGDDVLDLPVFRRVGFTACPSDSHPMVLQRADFRSTRAGGSGAVREFIDLVLTAQGRMDLVSRKYWEGSSDG